MTIRHGTPFRAAQLFALAIAALGAPAALNQLGPYEGRGKGRTRRHDNGGTRAHQRAATKRRNVQRHRKACRG